MAPRNLYTLFCSTLLWASFFRDAEAFTGPSGGTVACRCADDGKPACALGGVVFPSQCQLMCAGAQLRGMCGAANANQCADACKRAAGPLLSGGPPGAMCPALSQPVCTKLGAVLDNPCMAQAFQAAVRYNCSDKGYSGEQCARECFTALVKDVLAVTDPPAGPPPGCPCDKTHAPVCGKSGRVYGNQCLLECAKEEFNYPCTTDVLSIQGPISSMPGLGGLLPGGFADDAVCAVQCKADAILPGCDARCADQPTTPVCTVTGDVFGSACQAVCRRAMPKFACSELGLDGDACASRCSCMGDCAKRATLVADPPVCGASGKMWMSSCEMQCAGDGACDAAAYSPVCAADGRVIPSSCQAKCNGVEINEQVQCSGDPADQADCQQRCQAAAEANRCRWCDTAEWAPVCALDGSVVPSACLAKCKGIPVNWSLQCPQGQDRADECTQICASSSGDCGCDPAEYAPVCAADGSVVSSACLAKCKGVDVDWSLACPQEQENYQQCADLCAGGTTPDPCGCDPNTYTPVCGSDGIVWDNDCQAKCMGAEVIRDVVCNVKQGIACAEAAGWTSPGWDCGKCAGEPDAPVCAAEGMVLQNQCLARCNSLTFSYECGDRQDCVGDCYRDAGLDSSGDGTDCSACDMSLDPVCASNGHVYDNACLATCQGDTLSVLYSCSEPDASGQVPPDCAVRCQQEVPRPVPILPQGCGKCLALSAVIEVGCEAARLAGKQVWVCGYSGIVEQHPCFLRCRGDDVRFQCGNRTNCAADCLAARQAEDSLPSGCDCVDINAPVCAASGLVQPNQCTSVCAGYEPWFECGALSGRQCTAACRAVYQQYLADQRPSDVPAGARMADTCGCSGAQRPVCATSGTVYDNPCRLKCAKATKRFDCGKRSASACAADCLAAVAAKASVCAAGTKPVCATNGKVLPSPCALQVAKLTRRWDCGARKNCARDCLAAAKPAPAWPKPGKGVCGKDGKMYANECLAKKAKTTKRFDCGSRLDCKGDCAVAAAPKKHCGCKPDLAPVCAKSGAVFTNGCLLKCAKAVKRQACGRILF
ncbi:hypothetical protein ABPG75_002582 [Micractinium tetrahymenae]